MKVEPKTIKELSLAYVNLLEEDFSLELTAAKLGWFQKALKSYLAWAIEEAEPKLKKVDYSNRPFLEGAHIAIADYKQNLKKLLD